jgi:hypothetical protein
MPNIGHLPDPPWFSLQAALTNLYSVESKRGLSVFILQIAFAVFRHLQQPFHQIFVLNFLADFGLSVNTALSRPTYSVCITRNIIMAQVTCIYDKSASGMLINPQIIFTFTC